MIWIRNQFQPVDNSPLILFRIIFGLLIFAESLGAILTGWVRRVLIEPEFNFTIIGFEWLQAPDGYAMYIHFSLMAICGLMVMLGFYYRIGIATFTILWTMVYMMQKSAYNNHYYFLILLCLFMLIVPAHAYASMDAKRKNSIVSTTCPRWSINIFILQMWIVFTFAAIHKLYPGWVNGDFISLSFLGKSYYWLIGDLLQNAWLQQAVIFGGIAFDGLVIYFLLYRKTRIGAFIVSLIFHLFNSVVFQIGIFPYLMIGLCVFFFNPESVRKLFFKKKPVINLDSLTIPRLSLGRFSLAFVFICYFILQLYLPLRHHLYKGDVFYTEEGHRLAWRMMLRYKTGNLTYHIRSTESDSSWVVKPNEFLTVKQSGAIVGKPDMIWQFAKYLDRHYKSTGVGDVEVRAEAFTRLNNGPTVKLIDDQVDLTEVPWEPLKHSDWILSPDK